MNNACPTCGAVYAVAAKDVGRKIKCKKCSTSLIVADSGLVVDGPPSAASPPPGTGTAAPLVAAAVIEDDEDDASVVKSKKVKKPYDRAANGPPFIEKIGGIPTILFGVGTFFVIFFTFMTPIGEASTARAKAGLDKLKHEVAVKIKKLQPKGKTAPTEAEIKKLGEDREKLTEEYEKKGEEAEENAASARTDNIRSALWDKYGQMFGFLFLSFGCIGYLRTEQALIMRIVAAVILAFMMMIMFTAGVGGCGGSKLPLG